MDARAAFSGTADGRFERVVSHLVTRTGFVPAGLGPDVLVGHFEGSERRIVVARYGRPGDDGARWIEGARAGGVDLVVVGGPTPPDGVPFGGAPSEEGVIRWYMAEDGAVYGAGATLQFGELRPYLDDVEDPPDWPRFWAVIDGRVAAVKEVAGFQAGIRGRKAYGTPVLVAVIVAVYLLGTTWGAPDYMPALTRLGSLDGDLVRRGEVWRLLSHTFLHGSVIHLAMNMWVLWSLRGLERVIGTARYLTVYVCAGIAGGLASMVFSTGYAVGASGALWGLMTAQMVLGWRGKGILPTVVLKQIRDGSLRNLAVNIGISFLPVVSASAHAGGGVAGAALGLLGVVTVGLPRWAELAPGEAAPPDRVPAWLKVGSWVSGGLLAVSLGCALLFGRVWEAAAPPVLARAALGSTGWSAEVPVGLRVVTPEAGGPVLVGDVRSDPAAVDLTLAPLPTPPTDEEREAAYAEYTTAFLGATAEGLRASGDAVRVEVDGATVLEQRFVGDQVVLSRAVVVGEHGVVFTNVVYWKDAAGDWDTVARRVAASAAPGATAAAD